MGTLAQATLDALPETICLLDSRGVILSVNRAWLDFAQANGVDPAYEFVGRAYAAPGAPASGQDDDLAEAFRAGLLEVLAGQRQAFSLEYPCHGPSAQRWFIATATRYHEGAELHVAVSHADVTARHGAEASRRSKDADAARRNLDRLAWTAAEIAGQLEVQLGGVRRALREVREHPDAAPEPLLLEADRAAEQASRLAVRLQAPAGEDASTSHAPS
jgi:hypothetical protein